MGSNLELKPAIQYELTELAEILTCGFEDYFVPIKFTRESLAGMLRLDGVDLNTSQVLLRDGEPVGCGLMAHRGWTTRLAAMGVAIEARGTGIGKWAMREIIQQAKARGDRKMMLEVIEQNEPGVRLYSGCGFESMRRLVGYSCETPVGQPHGNLEEIDPRQVARILSEAGPADLPWQASAATIAQFSPPSIGVRLDKACAVISDPEQSVIAIRSIVTPIRHQRKRRVTQLLQTLFHQYPGKSWKVPPIFPAEMAPGLFEKLGFTLDEISQFQMELVLS